MIIKIPGGAQGGLTIERLRQITQDIPEADSLIYLYIEENGHVFSVREIEVGSNSIVFKGLGTS